MNGWTQSLGIVSSRLDTIVKIVLKNYFRVGTYRPEITGIITVK